MPTSVAFPICLLQLKIGTGVVHTEPLFVSGFSRLANNTETAADALRRLLVDYFQDLEPRELIRHRRALAARPQSFALTVDPPRQNKAWREPVEAKFHAAVWEHEGGYVLARIPALDIELIATADDDLLSLLRKEALAALRRNNATVDLRSLVQVPHVSAFRITPIEVNAELRSLKEREKQGENETKKTTLETVASRMHPQRLDPAFEVGETVLQLADAFTAKPAQSVLLVGPSGVGKTAALREFVRQKSEYGLAHTPFFQTTGSRIVAGQCGFGMWEQRCQELVKDASKVQAVVALGPLIELMNVGKSEFNPTGLASFLRPFIARGELQCVAECTPEQLPAIEREDPQLLDAFRQITMEEPDEGRGRTILAAFSRTLRRREPSPEAMAVLDRLHRRYATYSAYPGRPLRFLENLLRDHPPAEIIRESEVYEAFSRETGLPKALLDPTIGFDVAATKAWFTSRVIGQAEAADRVVDLMATLKAGLTRPNRPIASFLFIGPTGVGKTEMAKALAEFLFGSKDRLTRFDMSEFADPISVRRLVGGVFGREGLLTAKVREQPFSVILLDEVEKADPSVFDLLLQALGEARLTDAGGRLADFRNAVVILTSNLGAESFRAGQIGFGGSKAGIGDAAAHFTSAVESFLRPEMVNRLDRIVAFDPLGSEVIRRLAEREWQKVLARDGVRFRDLRITAGEPVMDRIAAVGFDVRYGARPLQRAMERELLSPLARQLNRYTVESPLSAEVEWSGKEPVIAVKPSFGSRRMKKEPNSPAGRLAERAQTHRRWQQLLERSSTVRELTNEVFQLQQRERRILSRQAKGKPLDKDEQQCLAQLGRLRELNGSILQQRQRANELEDEAVLLFHDGERNDDGTLREQLDRENKLWDELLLELFSRTSPPSPQVNLVLFGEQPQLLARLVRAYCDTAENRGLNIVATTYLLPADPLDLPLTPTPNYDRKKPAYWHDDRLIAVGQPKAVAMERVPGLFIREGSIGVALSISGKGSHLCFGAEAGLHEFPPTTNERTRPAVWIVAPGEGAIPYVPDLSFTRRGAIPEEPPRRKYAEARIDDRDFPEPFTNLHGSLSEQLAVVIDAGIRKRLVAIVLE
jgi:ATP-dependent Clp protease ATP-binding subunit ClpA